MPINYPSKPPLRLAYFISSHGFGHASRSAAIMTAIHEQLPEIQFEIFSQIPGWFFTESITEPYIYHPVQTDVGVIQNDPLVEDLRTTLLRLDGFYPLNISWVSHLAEVINTLKCDIVVSDISPLGIAVARAAGKPSVLVENFTWDWIYEGYVDREPEFARYITYLDKIFSNVNYHIQTQPVCVKYSSANMVVPPIARKPKENCETTRARLGIGIDTPLILITMGGIQAEFNFLPNLQKHKDLTFVIPGASKEISTDQNLILLPHHSEFYHPDLVNCCTAVVGKAGYSTIAEAYHMLKPFGYINRSQFREAPVLGRFIQNSMSGIEIPEKAFTDGNCRYYIDRLLSMQSQPPIDANGADSVASFVLDLIYHTTNVRV